MVGNAILNLSVSGATIEDIYSLGLPGVKISDTTRILIGLDPWILNTSSNESRWRSLESTYDYWQKTVTNGTPLSSVIYPEVHFQDNQVSLMSNFYNQFNAKHLGSIPRDGTPEILAKKAQDGSIIYGLEYRNMSSEEIRAGFSGIHTYQEMHLFKMSDGNLSRIRSLISYLKANSVAVEIVLAPYHPELYAELESESIGYETAEAAFKEMAKQQGIVIRGSYDPQNLGCKPNEFYDGMHPREVCMSKALNYLKNN
jgi:hypothetical protein